MFKPNEWRIETREDEDGWRVRLVHDDGSVIENSKPYRNEVEAKESALVFIQHVLVRVVHGE